LIYSLYPVRHSNLRSRSAVRTKENAAKIWRDCVSSSSAAAAAGKTNTLRRVCASPAKPKASRACLWCCAPTHVVKMKTEVCAGRYFSRQQSILFIEPSVPARDNQLGSKELYRCMYALVYIARGADLYILFIAHSLTAAIIEHTRGESSILSRQQNAFAPYRFTLNLNKPCGRNMACAPDDFLITKRWIERTKRAKLTKVDHPCPCVCFLLLLQLR
jgi:hypothetical protein